MKINKQKYETAMSEVNAECERKVQRLADRVYREVVIPLCKKYSLDFYSGMGSYSFHAVRGKYTLAVDPILNAERVEHLVDQAQGWFLDGSAPREFVREMEALAADLRDAYEVLDLEFGDQNLGYYVRDYEVQKR